MEEKLPENKKIGNDLLSGLGEYSDATTLFAPIVFFGIFVYIMSKIFAHQQIAMIASVFVAFIFTNISIYRKMKVIIAKYSKENENKKSKEKQK